MCPAISLAVGSVEDASVSQWGGEDRKVSRGAELVGPEKRRKAGLLGRLYSKSAGHQVSYRENLVHWQLPMRPAVQNSRPTQEAESSEYTHTPERYTHGS